MSRPSAAARLLFGAMAVATPLVVAAKLAAAPPPPEPLAGLIAPNIPGVSATPDRVWAATLQTFRAAGLPAPRGARWAYLPWDTPVTAAGHTIDGVAYPTINLVRINPLKATGDGRDIPGIMAHEVAHLVSYGVQTRVKDDAAEEAVAEAIAHDLVPSIRHRLRIDAPDDGTYSYQQQVIPFVRGTYRACRRAMPRAKHHRVERCARHTRRAFLVMDQANRTHALGVWGIQLPAIPPREHVHAWIADHPARTVNQQLIVERRRWAAERRQLRGALRARYRKDVNHALALSSIAFGVHPHLLRRIAFCESSLIPGNGNGRYEGLFAFGLPLWNGTGFHWFSRYDPYAASLAAAKTISNGGISHWYPSRHCWGGR